MSRPIVLSNGHMHVGLNTFGLVHDFYFPYVGQENHAAAKHLRHRIGIYVDGKFSWLDDGSWQFKLDYYGDVLVSRIITTNQNLQVRLEFDDAVDSDLNAFMRNIHVINMANEVRDIKLFMHQVFVISDSNASDTVQYVPGDESYIMHYKGHRVFLVNGAYDDGSAFDDYSVGIFGREGKEGTFRDAEDGELMKNNVEHGMVDSVMGFTLTVKANSSRRVHYWISAGRSEREAKRINDTIKQNGLLHHVLATANWWSSWIKPAKQLAEKLPEEYRDSFIRSSLIVKSQIDSHGAVIASTDTTMLNYSRDAYAYCWPRDAAYVLWPLLRIGYTEELLRFFAFARRGLDDGGYLGHKYQADGSLGPSWHPYIQPNGDEAPPIQTDETAGVLFLFGQYYRKHPEPELLTSFYATLVEPMANFLSSYVDEDGLPLPSYDLWEEKYLTTTYTTALTYGALLEAAGLAELADDDASAIRWRTAAEQMVSHVDTFYNSERKYFYKGFVSVDGVRTYDSTIDSSSLFGAFMFGFMRGDDSRMNEAHETLKSTLLSDGARVIRYEDEIYCRRDGEPSNPWPVASLWLAQFELELGNEEQTKKILDWVNSCMFSTGVIAEQYGKNNDPLSVAPLTWSHAEYLNVLLDMITDKESER